MIKKATFNKKKFKKEVEANTRMLFRRTLDEATPQQIYQAVAYSIKDDIIDNWIETHKAYAAQDKKTVYYMSMEFLMGRALGNNMINLTCYDEVREALEEMGLDLNVIEDQEPDAALGNGGWQPASWIPWLPLDIRHTAAVSVTTMVCSNRRSRTAIRSRRRTTG